MAYSPSTPGWVTLRSSTALETAMANANLNGNELARKAETHRQNVANIRRGRTQKIREDIAGSIERALGVSRGSLFDYQSAPDESAKMAAAS